MSAQYVADLDVRIESGPKYCDRLTSAGEINAALPLHLYTIEALVLLDQRWCGCWRRSSINSKRSPHQASPHQFSRFPLYLLSCASSPNLHSQFWLSQFSWWGGIGVGRWNWRGDGS